MLSKTNRYEEVTRGSESWLRNFEFIPKAFEPVLKASEMETETRACNWKSIVGTGEAYWFSPNANNSSAPYCDAVALRSVEDNVKRLKNCWLSRLCEDCNMLLRRKGNDGWGITVGDICGTIVKTWPTQHQGGFYVPTIQPGTTSDTHVIVDLSEWEAVPLKILSPMHCAIKTEKTKLGIEHKSSIDIRPQHEYGFLPVCAIPIDCVRPLLETTLRRGFGSLAPSYLVKLAEHVECPTTGILLIDLLLDFARFVIDEKEQTNELFREILDIRRVTFEQDCDVDCVVELEFIIDTFDPKDRTELEKEVKSARGKKSEADAFTNDVSAWKVLSTNG